MRRAVAALPRYRPGRSSPGAIKLSSNELPFDPLPPVAAAIAAAGSTPQRYPDHLAAELRRHLASHFDTSPERVATGPGAVGLLQQLALAHVEPGEEVVYGDPSFEAYPIFTGLVGGVGKGVPLRRLALDVPSMIAALTERTRLVLLANPNNPTGTAISAPEVQRLADSLPAGCLLVVDEAYHEFRTGRHTATAAPLALRHPQVVVLRTFSKAHGLAGLRVGYLLGDPEVVDAVDRALIPFSVGSIGQAAALASLGAAEEMADRVSAVVANRARLAGGLRQLGWSVPDPQANFVWLPVGLATDALASALADTGVVARAFSGVGLRVTAGSAEQVDAFLHAFARVSSGGAALENLAAAWGLPAGDDAARVNRWLERLHGVELRLVGLCQRGRLPGLGRPDPGGDERWDSGQIWAHLGEIGDYWIDQLEHVLDAGAAAGDADTGDMDTGDVDTGPVPFGRVKTDEARVAAVAAGRALDPPQHEKVMLAAMDRLRALLAGLSTADWSRQGQHSTLGTMGLDRILDEFLIGHWEQHAAQLETLGD